jgi:ABC-type Na+ efflux pump permease subunit
MFMAPFFVETFMENYLPFILIFAIFGILLLESFLPSPTHDLRKRNPLLFWLAIGIVVVSTAIVVPDFIDTIMIFVKSIISFVKTGVLIS